MKLRKASPEDEAAVLELYREASVFLASQGIDQWQDGYPNREAFQADLARGESWVVEEGGRVLATACLGFGREPTYDRIYQGSWAVEAEEYAFLHRIAVSGELRGKNAPSLFFGQLEQDARRRGLPCLRGDTHRDNKIMQHVLEKNGLSYRGVIYLADGGERFAFEKVL
ncbi:MAG: GNAT family N-acetyltransferase [Acutalibacter sp.]|jgi:GNAT superfamily N-acetyltransferase